ncbi:EAL domain-containing protein [Planctomycetes bacterium Poly30]|uniref:EAL domain-containing protein n=1 Tax=Saltatorellus ferox TaxID=2528018 RepID=UPI0011A53BCD
MSQDTTRLLPLQDWIQYWTTSAEAQSRPPQGVFCIEIKDRSPAGGVLGPGVVAHIWDHLSDQDDEPILLGKIDDTQVVVVAEAPNRWASLAARVVECAVTRGVLPHDVGVGIGHAEIGPEGVELARAVELAAAAALQACDQGIGFKRRGPADERADARSHAIDRNLKAALQPRPDGASSDTGGLRLLYQPKVDAQSEAIVSVEALLRFECPSYGAIPTGELIARAEANGLGEALDRWVLGRVIHTLDEFDARWLPGLPISMNLGARTALRPGFVEAVEAALAAARVDPGLLEIELREDEMLANLEAGSRVISDLTSLGVSVALDGFGRNRTTLSDLRRLRVATLKLDRSIVAEMMSDENVQMLAHGMLHLARVMQMETVAVGIETKEQHEHLRQAGCATLQGYLFHKPMERDAIIDHVLSSEAFV